MKKYRIITVSECEIKEILAEKYGVLPKHVRILHEDYEVAGFSGHAISTTHCKAKILIDRKND